MLTVVAFVMVLAIIVLLLSQRASPIVAFSVVPVVAALVAGFSLLDIGKFASRGMATVFPTAALFIFAILYFGLMRDRGLFDPVVNGVLRRTGNRPVSVTVATVIVATIAHLDGIGAATFLLTIPAFLPVYRRLQMRPELLVLLTGVSAGVMNLVPWGGPTARAAAALHLDTADLWRPLIPVQLFGIVLMLLIAVLLGLREKRRIGGLVPAVAATVPAEAGRATSDLAGTSTASRSGSGTDAGKRTEPANVGEDRPLALPVSSWRYWANVVLTIAILVVLFTKTLPIEVTFVVGLGIAFLLNFADPKQQNEQIAEHAESAVSMGAILLSAGVFLGILSGTHMIDEVTQAILGVLPGGVAGHIHLIIGALAVPLGMVFGADPYYFGLLPIVSHVAGSAGVPPVGVAQAMLLGENVGFVVSPVVPTIYLALGLAGVELGRHIRFTFLWAWGTSLLMLAFAVLIGVVPVG